MRKSLKKKKEIERDDLVKKMIAKMKKLGMNQIEVSRALGLKSAVPISRWINGDTTPHNEVKIRLEEWLCE